MGSLIARLSSSISVDSAWDEQSPGLQISGQVLQGSAFMNIGPGGAALIWLHLLLPGHWPVLVAGFATALYRRRVRSRGKFFLMSWILGYGVQGLVSVPWPLVWMAFFDKQEAASNALPSLAVNYLYLQSAVSASLTVWAIHVIATKYWHRLDS